MLGKVAPALRKTSYKFYFLKHYSENVTLIIWLRLSFTQHDYNLVSIPIPSLFFFFLFNDAMAMAHRP